MRRRRFLEGCGYGLAGLLAARPVRLDVGVRRDPARREIAADVVIVGGGLGGCAAALAALRNGRTVVLTEPTDWIGGQLTVAGRAARRAPLDRAVRRECIVPGACGRGSAIITAAITR